MEKAVKKKILQEHQIYDFRTGERVSETKVMKLPSEPSFVKMYIEDISLLNGLGKNGNDVLREIVSYIDYSGEIVLTPARKKEIAEKHGITDRTVRNQIALLVKKGIIKNKTYLTYVANPSLFAKGDWKHISKLRDEYQLVITYKNGKRKVKSSSDLIDESKTDEKKAH